MIIKKAVYKNKKIVRNIQISPEVYGCDNCKKEMKEHRHDMTVHYNDGEAKYYQFCSWQCVAEFFPKIKTDYFVSLPFVHFDNKGNKGFGIKDFLKVFKTTK